MIKNRLLLFLLLATLGLSGCAPTIKETLITTNPPEATLAIEGIKVPGQTPLNHYFDFSAASQYNLLFSKEGYFEEEFTVKRDMPAVKNGITVNLTPSPLWEATTFSPATNNWIQLLVGPDLDAKMAWQIMIDAAIKRSSNIHELNYESGYLQTKYTVKKFDTKNGEFLLRCQLIATLVSSEPLIYRLKDVSEWSGNGVQWHPYNRIFIEHAEMITEIQDRLGSN